MKQLDLMTAIARKEHGLDTVEEKSGDFVPLMRAVAESIAKEKGSVTSDDLRRYADKHGIKPHHPNAWGAVFRKGFRCIGRKKSSWSSAHAREVKVWAI